MIRDSRPNSNSAKASTLGLPATQLSPKCVRTASDAASLERQYAAAKPGQTICLRSGDYGTFRAGRKSGSVGVRGAPGANAVMQLEFASVTNLHLDHVVIPAAEISGVSRDITISNSRFTGLAVVRSEEMVNANIVFDHNVHANINTCTTCFQGRLHIDGNNGQPSGITVENSVFSGGNSDGVRPDADSVKVIDNEFYGFRDQDPFHTDPIQIYGGTRALIRGNYFHDNLVSAQIMMADGGAHNIVEDNVISGGGYTWAITWYADDGSIIRNNTFQTGRCSFHVRCGIINLGSKPGDPHGKGTVIQDNVIGGISNGAEGGSSQYVASNNLTATRIPGQANVVGLPRFVGPLNRYSGYKLSSSSPGARRASNGLNPGIG